MNKNSQASSQSQNLDLNKPCLADSQSRGELFALSLTLIEAWFPIFAFFTVAALGGLHAYFYSLLVAVLFLFIWWVWRGKQAEIRLTSAYKNLGLTTLFITSLFALTFIGLQYTTATNVAIILFLQILFSYLFLGRRQEERLNLKQVSGALLMTLGALLILFPGSLKANIGDLFVLGAAMLAPIANLYQKKARAQVSSETILLVRSVIALPFIYLLASLFELAPSIEMLESQFVWLLLTGFLVFFVAKVLWVEAIYILPITKVNALFAFAPLMTMGLAYLVLNQVPNLYQILGMLPILMGGYLITRR
ncbi:EamA family transporter [Thiomicrorhabdus immobilis]|uniref:EamA family transporter n=1 Tax=Thiomicrorhabdus immobilis TaxID=2791037 RepID=A0ABM7MD98_9GAMM|nr:DMT family transporter [Thiomicrorhabdus immobilis]BCN93296.1 EamA family transporter [Thiomicrorhabdus immobilis]